MNGDLCLRAATEHDRPFVHTVTEAAMRGYAEQTWGYWDGRAELDLNPARAFSERQGFRLTHTVPPRHHLERPVGGL
jgi:hypothetical protein